MTVKVKSENINKMLLKRDILAIYEKICNESGQDFDKMIDVVSKSSTKDLILLAVASGLDINKYKKKKSNK